MNYFLFSFLTGLIPLILGLGSVLGSAITSAATAPAPPAPTGAPAVAPLPLATPASAIVAAALSNAIQSADIAAAAQIFSESDDITGLVQGLQIPPGTDVFPSFDRNLDQDVVAIKAIALAVLSSGGLENKLTLVTFQSVIFRSVEGKPDN